MALTKVKNSNLEDADLVALAGNDGSALTGVVKTSDIGSGADQIVQLDGDGKLPAIDGSALTGVVKTSDIGSGANQIVQLNGDGKLPEGVDSLPSQTSQSGKFLTTNGSAASWGTAGGGMQSWQIFTSSGTWTRPSGITKIRVTVTGGGGGGGGAKAYTGKGGSGGGGGGTSLELIDVSAVTSQLVTIGSGGTGGSADNDGNNGGASSFGSYCSANGGLGGKQNIYYGNHGSAGGTSAEGDINLDGEGGWPGGPYATSGQGHGGGSYWGGGGLTKIDTNGDGTDGVNKGSGGGGALSTANGSADWTGGSGGNGFVLVEEFA